MNYFVGRKSAPSPVKAVVTTESSDLRTKIETFECSRVILIATDAQRGKDTNFHRKVLEGSDYSAVRAVKEAKSPRWDLRCFDC